MACVFSVLKSVRVHGAHCLVDTRSSQHGAVYRMLGFTVGEHSSVTASMDDDVTVLMRFI